MQACFEKVSSCDNLSKKKLSSLMSDKVTYYAINWFFKNHQNSYHKVIFALEWSFC